MVKKLPRGMRTYMGWEGARIKKRTNPRVKGGYVLYLTKQRGLNAPYLIAKRKNRERIYITPTGKVLKRRRIEDNPYAWEGRIKTITVRGKRFKRLV